MDGYELICIHVRHNDNGMSLDIMLCWNDIDIDIDIDIDR